MNAVFFCLYFIIQNVKLTARQLKRHKRIDDAFVKSSYPAKSEPEQAFLLRLVSFLGNLKLFLSAICGAVTFTLLLITTNVFSISVQPRRERLEFSRLSGSRTVKS